jgi:microcin C transport system ATP-binding protein
MQNAVHEAPLVSYLDFHASFGSNAAAKEAVAGISFHINEHETVALVGESGSGKTVTAQALLRLQSEDWIHYRGEVRYQGNDILKMDEAALRRLRGQEFGMVFQEPMTSLNPLHRIGKQVAEALGEHRRSDRLLVIDWLKKVGLRDAEKRFEAWPHELSGGERQRVMIAMALINKPRLLIADEPTTALDVTIQSEIIALLKTLQAELGMAILFITHDLNIVRRLADRVIVMRDGKIIESGPQKTIFSAPKEAYTKLLIGSDDAQTAPGASVPDTGMSDTPSAVRGENLKVYFPIKKGFLRRTSGYIKAVDGVDFAVRRGQTLGIVGESGSGKTTLGKALLNLLPGDAEISGAITIGAQAVQTEQGKTLTEKSYRLLRRKIQMIFQDPYGSLSPRMTVREIVGEGLLIHNIGEKNERPARIEAALADVGMDNPAFGDRYPNEFSGGQRQRIALARSLVLEPEILVLDEPTSSLDRTIQYQVVDLLRKLQEKHRLSYLFISHDLRIIRALSHQIIIMQAGKVVEAGPTAQIFSSPQNAYTRQLLSAIM